LPLPAPRAGGSARRPDPRPPAAARRRGATTGALHARRATERPPSRCGCAASLGDRRGSSSSSRPPVDEGRTSGASEGEEGAPTLPPGPGSALTDRSTCRRCGARPCLRDYENAVAYANDPSPSPPTWRMKGAPAGMWAIPPATIAVLTKRPFAPARRRTSEGACRCPGRWTSSRCRRGPAAGPPRNPSRSALRSATSP